MANELMHYGTPHVGMTPHSGRYPWQGGESLRDILKKNGRYC